MCTRTWCVRPVRSRHSIRLSRPPRSPALAIVRQRVTARLPFAVTAKRFRSAGWRPTAASMVPAQPTGSPHTRARFWSLPNSCRQWRYCLQSLQHRHRYSKLFLPKAPKWSLSCPIGWSRLLFSNRGCRTFSKYLQPAECPERLDICGNHRGCSCST